MPTLTYEDLRANLNDYAQSRNLTFSPKFNAFVRDGAGILSAAMVSPDDLARRAHIEYRGDQVASYRTAISQMLEEDRADRQRRQAEMLCNVDDPYDLAQAELKRFVKLMAHADTEPRRLEYYEVGWRQLIWQVKRKMLGFDTSWEIMMSLVSRNQGTGKTHAAKDFGYVLGEFFMANGDCSLLSDGFRVRGLQRYYLVLLDEFDRANKTQVTSFKRLISTETVASRQIYTDSDLNVQRNASFIVTSNRSIAYDIADSSMRRFVEMRCREQSASDVFIDAMNELDWMRIWSVADARDPEAPAYTEKPLLGEFQAELATESEFDEWASERMFLKPDNRFLRVRLAMMYADYQDWARNQGLKYLRKHAFFREVRERYDVIKVANVEHAQGAGLRNE